jgi:hypothetical protein
MKEFIDIVEEDFNFAKKKKRIKNPFSRIFDFMSKKSQIKNVQINLYKYSGKDG